MELQRWPGETSGNASRSTSCCDAKMGQLTVESSESSVVVCSTRQEPHSILRRCVKYAAVICMLGLFLAFTTYVIPVYLKGNVIDTSGKQLLCCNFIIINPLTFPGKARWPFDKSARYLYFPFPTYRIQRDEHIFVLISPSSKLMFDLMIRS